MGAIKSHDILVTQLQQIETPGGDVLHAMKQIDLGYEGFGEAYFSWISGGAIKAWKRHLRMTMNLIVPVGQVKFVFYYVDADTGLEKFITEEIGENRYVRLTVPPGVWFGFEGLYEFKSLVLNIASIPHHPDEVERLALTEVNYNWIRS